VLVDVVDDRDRRTEILPPDHNSKMYACSVCRHKWEGCKSTCTDTATKLTKLRELEKIHQKEEGQ